MSKSTKKTKKETNKFLEVISKYKLYIISLVFIVLFMALYLVFGLKDQSYAIDSDDTDHLVLECPSAVNPGEEFECSYGFNVVSIKGMSFQVNPVLKDKSEIDGRDNLEFLGYEYGGICNENSCTTGDSGIVYFSLVANLSGKYSLGKLKYKVPADALPDEEYAVMLIDGMLAGSDNNDETANVTFDEVTSVIRIASSVNTLSNITLSEGTLNENVTADRNTYTAVVDSDMVTINVLKNDDNSTIEGNLENISLHYGTNVITFDVIGENGSRNTYTITITRPYEFSSDNYIYNKDNNYLYTRTNTDSETIIANITLDSGLSSSISDGKLIIKYGEEVLKTINIINVKFGEYTLSSNKLYINDSIDIASFKNDIIMNGVNVKIFNNETEVNSGNLSSDYKIRVYYNDTLLEEYGIASEYLRISNDLVVDDANHIIKRLSVNTNYSNIKNKIETSGIITIKNSKGTTLGDNDKVKTGDVIEIKLGTEIKSYTISVLGDVNGDGKINTADVTRLYRYVKGRIEMSKVEVAASDIINDGNVQTREVTRLYRYIKGRSNEL